MRYTGRRSFKKRGQVPRFVVVGSKRTIAHPHDVAMVATDGTTLAHAFERAALALPYDRAFSDIEIVAHKSRRNGRSLELTLIVDRPAGSVDLSTCERIAARINRALDAFPEPYTLEVESAGLDRPLLRPEDYERFCGCAVRIVTSLAIESRKTHRGTLLGVRGNAVILHLNGSDFPIPLELIKSANVDFDIRADLTRAKKERKNARKNR